MLVANASHDVQPSPGEDSLLWTGSYSIVLKKKKKPVPVTVNLTTKVFELSRKNYSETFEFDEIASCAVAPYEEIAEKSRCLKGSKDRLALESDVCLQLVLYPSKNNSRRCRRVVTLLVGTHTDYEDNLNEAKLLQDKFSSLIHIGHANSKPVLIILNPKSGKGQSIKIFERKVRPLLEDCNVKYHMLVTKYPNHASEFIESNADLASSYSAIVTLSGDGLLFEVLNGFANLLDRSDCTQIPIPLSIIPGGSGNGLAHSINHIYLNGNKSCNQIFDCTFHVIKGKPTDMDIVRVTTLNKVYYSFLSFGWGLMADVDIESERLRCIGEPRFAFWSIYRSVVLKKYGGTLSYLPIEKSGPAIPPIASALDESWVVEKGHFVLVYAAYQRYLNSSVKFAPDSKLDDKTIYLLYIKEGVSTCQVIQFLLALEEGAHVKLPYVHFVPVRAFRLEPQNSTDIMTVDGEQIECSVVQAEVVPRMVSILLRA